MNSPKFSIIVLVSFVVAAFTASGAQAQSVPVGKGSYATSLASGQTGPQYANGQPAVPKITSGFSKPVQTTDFWSSLLFPFFGDLHSNVMYAHPLALKAGAGGLTLGYTPTPVTGSNEYVFPYQPQLTAGVSGLTATLTLTDDYGDWTVRALWENGGRSMKATFGHGLPFVFFEVSGGNATLTFESAPTIWSNQNGVLGLTFAGRHYGVFAPAGASWSGSNVLQSSLNGKTFYSVAILPDNTLATLEFYRKRAYAFVRDAKVSWQYNEQTALLESTFDYETELMESGNGNLNETLSALYRHQWLYTPDTLTSYTYNSPRGTMKVFSGNRFTTRVVFTGVLPGLPDEGSYNRADLLAQVKSAATRSIPNGPTYENGKEIGRFAYLLSIADQLGAVTERNFFVSEIKRRVEAWLTAGGTEQYVYNAQWDVLTGYPSGYGADQQINDHHFHHGYTIIGAALVAQYDSAWASQENWGGMVNLLIKDAANWERTDTRFPFLRSHDAYAGHSWAAGHGDFGDGNNQESSSESMNFSSAVALWGMNTSQKDIRDLGIFLHATERTAIEEYWFDVHDAVFPSAFNPKALGIVWGNKGVHSTWFGGDPEFIHGINFLPMQGGSLYLGRHPEYVRANFNEIVSERGGLPNKWKDVLWMFLSLGDPAKAFGLLLSDPNYEPFDGESRAHALHWIGNLKRVGPVDTSVTASVPSYAVFKDAGGFKTYTAYNPERTAESVQFSDGFSFEVAPRSQKSQRTGTSDDKTPVPLLITDKTSGKAPLTVKFEGGKSFDPNGEPLSYAWNFGNGVLGSSADTSITFTVPGAFNVKLTVRNSSGFSASDSTVVTVNGSGTPYGGTALTVPAVILAERYDAGGEGLAYHDVDPNNIGQAFRPSEGVDIENSGSGFNVYWLVAGEWLEYTINVPESGLYDLIPQVSTVPGFGYFHLSVNNTDVSGRRDVTSTGGWQTWRDIPVTNVQLEAGVQILRMDIGSDSDKSGWLFSLNSIEVKKSGGVANEEPALGIPDFALAQNYPNPFNPVTQIGFSLQKAGHTKITLYNVMGQAVMQPVNGFLGAGAHSLSIDATNLASGIYLYRLESGGRVLSRRMVLLK